MLQPGWLRHGCDMSQCTLTEKKRTLQEEEEERRKKNKKGWPPNLISKILSRFRYEILDMKFQI